MKGAIIGDIIGSQYEFDNIKTKNFELFTSYCDFTDDSVMTCAVAEALMRCKPDYSDLSEVAVRTMQEIGRHYPFCGFGGRFIHWIFSDNPQPNNSYGNGAAMRVSPVGFVAKDIEEAKVLARKVTEISHNHPEGLKGAEATAVAITMARLGYGKGKIKEVMERDYYVSEYTVDEYRKIINGHGDETCQVSMPQALQCFYEGDSYEDVIRNCISIGGDSDTLAAIAGGISEAYDGIPKEIQYKMYKYLDARLMNIVDRFYEFKKSIYK